jgi:nitroimidazol reductase NimA-like FMN-containing flavoprotein (pyridoxamine 5'-phosphate oxidase superfamily)
VNGPAEPSRASREALSLTAEECRALLPRAGVGRVVFVDVRGPVAIPVNFVRDGGDIVFRTVPWASVVASRVAGPVSFEIDDLDHSQRMGWSLLATGELNVIDDPRDLRHVELLDLWPWPEGPRDRYLRLEVVTITGRRVTFAGSPTD